MPREKVTLPGYKWLSILLRVMVLILTIYIEVFAFDVLKSDFSFWKTVLAFTIHSIPSIALLGVFFIALNWEHIAGFTLICFALMGTLPAGPPNDTNHFIYFILGSIAVIGITFVLNYFVLGNRKTSENI